MTEEFGSGNKADKRKIDARERKRRIESRDLLPAPSDADERATSEIPAAEDDLPVPPPPRKRRTSEQARFPALPDEARHPRRQPQLAAPPPKRGFPCRDLIALFFILAAIGLAGYFIYIWQNPYSPLNPLAPPLLPPLVVSQTPLPASTETPTPRPTARPSATFTPLPLDQIAPGTPGAQSETLSGTPDETATLLAGTPSATPPPPPFALLRSRALYIANAGAEGCSYSGIAGSVVDFNGQPLNGYTVWITGEEVDTRLVSGSDNLYGAGGFLVQVGTSAQERPYAAQVLAADGVTPLSEPYTFLTRATCENNVVLIRFVQVGELP
jgi:hypothetical protein